MDIFSDRRLLLSSTVNIFLWICWHLSVHMYILYSDVLDEYLLSIMLTILRTLRYLCIHISIVFNPCLVCLSWKGQDRLITLCLKQICCFIYSLSRCLLWFLFLFDKFGFNFIVSIDILHKIDRTMSFIRFLYHIHRNIGSRFGASRFTFCNLRIYLVFLIQRLHMC